MPELAPSKMKQIGLVLAYLTGAMIGISLIIRASEVIETGTIGVVSVGVSYVMIVIGCVAAVAAITYSHLVEYVCLFLMGVTISVYMVAFYSWSFTHGGAGATIALFLQMLLAFIISRFGELNRLVKFQKREGV